MLSACLLTKNAVYLPNYLSWPLSEDTSSIWPQMRPWSSSFVNSTIKSGGLKELEFGGTSPCISKGGVGVD